MQPLFQIGIISLCLFFLFQTTCVCSYAPEFINIGSIIPFTLGGLSVPDLTTAMKLALNDVNNNPNILPNTTLVVDFRNDDFQPDLALLESIASIQDGNIMLICCATSAESVIAAVAGTVYQKIFLATTSTSSLLSDREKYPYFARISPSDEYQSQAVIDILSYLEKESGLPQYKEVGIIVMTDAYGINGAKKLIGSGELTIKSYQQFLSGSTDLTVEMEEFRESKARVFISIIAEVTNFQKMIQTADEFGLVGPNYVWLCFDGCSSNFITRIDYTSEVDERMLQICSGLIGIQPSNSHGELYDEVNARWKVLDPAEYIVLNPGTDIGQTPQYSYDSIYFIAWVFHNVIEMGGFSADGEFLLDPNQFYSAVINTTANGVTGKIELDEIGNRFPTYSIVNLRKGSNPVGDLSIIGQWDTEDGLQLGMDIAFYDGSTQIPDIDIRHPFNYWSCPDREKKADLTGKTIELKLPGGSNPPNIDIDYHCDNFIDCENLSDESTDCSANYTIVFIVYGIVTGLLILLSVLFLILTIIFAFILPRKRMRAASPIFLIILCISCIIGFASTYAWYGKPHKVACGFQPWLLGLSIISLVASLFAKTFRIWRIFKSPFDRKIITDLELIILWAIMVVPAILILALWTLISTPTAELREVQGEEHYLCNTGGFTGPPGGYVFFFIFVGYTGIVLCFGAFLSLVTRDVPSLFNESKLVALSIYNLAFLSIVVIPVVIVLNSIQPFASWIIRTTAILYAFLATLIFQFLPKFLYILCIDKVKSAEVKDLDYFENTSTSTNMSTFQRIPEANSAGSD